jgi:hypothetical protein
MAKIKTLYQNGQQIMPVTHPKAVMDDDGETLEAKLSKINKRLEACGNGGSMSGQLVGSASGTSVSVSDALAAPLMGLRVWGKSTQDGVPTPTAPVPIVSAGDGGTVVVTVSDGANNSQTLTLQTPNALPGIPVTSGGNYTDVSGQQWVCDEVDLARGVHVQRVTKIKVTSNKGWVKTGTNVDRYFADFKTANSLGALGLCTHFTRSKSNEEVGGIALNATNQVMAFAYAGKDTSTIDDFKAFLDANEVYVWAILKSPLETPLAPAEIAAYKALTTYAPTTVISVSGGAGATVTYQRDAILVIKRLEEAIASTAAVSSLSM